MAQMQRAPRLVRQARAAEVIAADAETVQGKLFTMIAGLALNRLNAGFRLMDFVSRIRNVIPIYLTNDVPLGGVPATNTPRQIMTNAAGTLFTTANWTHQCPADRYRVIVAHRIELDGSAAAATAGNQEIGLGIANQIAQQGQTNIKRRAQVSIEQFPYGGMVAWRQGATIAGPINFPAAINQPDPWEAMCPFGIESAFRNSKITDFLQPNEQFQIQFSNLNGVVPAAVQVIHGTFKAVGFDILLG